MTLATVEHFTIKHRNRSYELIYIDKGDTRIQITLSPTGRSVHVYVNGEQWKGTP